MHNPIGHTSVGRYKVLVGDDDPAMLRLLSRWLENAGYPTRTVTDGQKVLEATELECPDFVITDWEMPRITGLELCRRLREMVLPHYVYILFLTVKATSEEMIAALDVGANNFLRKPVSQGELLARMRSGSMRWPSHHWKPRARRSTSAGSNPSALPTSRNALRGR